MITRIVAAVVVAVVVGLLLSALLGPILITLGVPIATLVGEFFVRWGWVLGICAGIWYFLYPYAGSWPWQRPPAA